MLSGYFFRKILIIFSTILISIFVFSNFAKADTYLGDINSPCFTFNNANYKLNPITNKIYRPNGNNICVTDATNNTTSTINLLHSASKVGINDVTNKIYAANSDVLSVVDGITNTSQIIYFNSPSEFIDNVLINSVTNKIYLTETDVTLNLSYLRIIDGNNNSLQTVTLPTHFIVDATVDLKNNRIYLVSENNDNLIVVNGANNTVEATISLPTFQADTHLDKVFFNEITNTIYCSWSRFENRIAVINGSNFSVSYINTGLSEAQILDINSKTNKVYFSAGQAGNYSIYSLDGNNIIQTVATDTFFVHGFEINRSANKLYLTNYQLDNVKIINENDGTSQTLYVGNEPGNILINSVTNKVFIERYFASNDLFIGVLDGDDNKTDNIAIGQSPNQIAVNPLNNKIYSVDSAANTVTIVNGNNNSFQNLAVGTNPQAIAVNRIANKIYVANFDSNDVTVINGSDNTTVQIPTGINPQAIAINEVTNKIYVASYAGSITVIDGATNTTETIATLTNDVRSIAVNNVTNKIYVASYANSSIIVIDGYTNSTAIIDSFNSPEKIAVNPVTNKIYIIDRPAGNLWILNGANNTFDALDIGAVGVFNDIDINPLTNRIYVANGTEIVVINGQNNTFSTILAGTSPRSVKVNSATNKIYATNFSSSNVTMIDGLTNISTNVGVGSQPFKLAINPITNKIYIGNLGSNSLTAISAIKLSHITLSTSAQALVGNISESTTPTFNLTASVSNFGLTPRNIYFQVDTINGTWQKATNIFGTSITLTASATTSSLTQGVHTLCYFATDGTDSTITPLIKNETMAKEFPLSSPQAGAVNGYQFAIKLTPTAANALIKGKLVNQFGRSVSHTRITLTNTHTNQSQSVLTNSFGYFSFENLESGQIYILEGNSKRGNFASQLINLTESISDLIITVTN